MENQDYSGINESSGIDESLISDDYFEGIDLGTPVFNDFNDSDPNYFNPGEKLDICLNDIRGFKKDPHFIKFLRSRKT